MGTMDGPRAFSRDERGTITIMAAGMMAIVIAMSAVVVDIGFAYHEKRRMQGYADLAALAAATDIANARAIALSNLRDNGVEDPQAFAVTVGTYTPDAKIPPKERFKPSPPALANAVAVAFEGKSPVFFGKAAGYKEDHYRLGVAATAARASSASIAIGSRLASLNGGIANAILGSILGSGVSLSAMDYNALAGAQVDLLETASALKTRLNLKAATYDDVLKARLQLPDILKAMAEKATSAQARSALNQAAASAAGRTASLSSLFDAGPYGSSPPGERPKMSVSASALDLLTAAVAVSDGRRPVSANLGLQFPGLASATVTLAIGERPQGTPMIRIGQTGDTVHTAQTRLLVDVSVGGSGLLAATSVRLPVYLEVAAADAKLKKISCGATERDSGVTLSVRPSVADAWIGSVGKAEFENVSRPLDPGPAEIARLPLASITAKSGARMGSLTPTDVTFSVAEIRAGKPKTVRSGNLTTSLTGSLLDRAEIKATVLGVGLGLDLGALTAAVRPILNGLTAPVDQILSGTLAALGIGVGEADAWVTGINCSGAVLAS